VGMLLGLLCFLCRTRSPPLAGVLAELRARRPFQLLDATGRRPDILSRPSPSPTRLLFDRKLQKAVGEPPVSRGHRTLALLAEALEEQAAEKADLFLDVSLFCADGDAMAGLPVPAAEFEAWASRVADLVRAEIRRGAGADAIALLRQEWGCLAPSADLSREERELMFSNLGENVSRLRSPPAELSCFVEERRSRKQGGSEAEVSEKEGGSDGESDGEHPSENACRRAALAVANASKEAASAWLDEHFDDDDIDDALIGKAASMASEEIVAYLRTLRFAYEGEEGEVGEKDGSEQGREDELAALEQGGADAELSLLLQMAGARAEENRLSLQHEQGFALREAKSAQPEPSLLESKH